MGAEDGLSLIFTYGTLKKGFSNHYLISAMVPTGDAVFLGPHLTADAFPLVCGPFRVPFLLNFPGSGRHVAGELYALSPGALAGMDELEGVSLGHYERRPIEVVAIADGVEGPRRTAEAYFAHGGYAAELWKKNREEGLYEYSEEAAIGYVKRGDRPRNHTFLEQIRIFVDS